MFRAQMLLFFFFFQEPHNSSSMYLSRFTSMYKAIFVLLAVTVVTCTAKLLLGLHQDLHYAVFPWPLFFFLPSKDHWTSLYIVWRVVSKATELSNIRIGFSTILWIGSKSCGSFYGGKVRYDLKGGWLGGKWNQIRSFDLCCHTITIHLWCHGPA